MLYVQYHLSGSIELLLSVDMHRPLINTLRSEDQDRECHGINELEEATYTCIQKGKNKKNNILQKKCSDLGLHRERQMFAKVLTFTSNGKAIDNSSLSLKWAEINLKENLKTNNLTWDSFK